MKQVNSKSIAVLVEENRIALPDSLAGELDAAVDLLAQGRWPAATRSRGKGKGRDQKIVFAILHELHLLLCTNDSKYKPVRTRGKSLSEGAVLAIAGYVSAKFDVSLAAGAAAVGFAALAIGRLTVGAFCRVMPKE